MVRTELFPSEDLTALDFRLIHGSLQTLITEEDRFEILIAGDDHSCDALLVEQQKDRLCIRQPGNRPFSGLASPAWLDVTVYVPALWKGSADFRVRSGALSVSGFSGSDLTFVTGSAQLKVQDSTGIFVSLRSRSGAIDVSGLDCDRCRLRSLSGPVNVTRATADQWSVTTLNASSSIALDGAFDRFSGRSVDGDLSVTLPLNMADASLRSLSGRIRTENLLLVEEAPPVVFCSLSGDLRLSSDN